jgi:hypothetical protein
MTTEVACPTCGTVAQLDDTNRDAQAFCRVCDYPLFWIRAAATGDGEGGLVGDQGLRRLPGTAGLVAVATLRCWNCDEHNPVTGIRCIRCGLELNPAPVVMAPLPPPEPPPVMVPEEPPPPPKPPLIPMAWVPALIAGVLLLLLCIVGAVVALLH